MPAPPAAAPDPATGRPGRWIVTHTWNVYNDFNAVATADGGWLGWIGRDGQVSLANTSGFFAWIKMPGQFRADVSIPIFSDHLQLGGMGGLGTFVGIGIKLDYLGYWAINDMGFRK